MEGSNSVKLLECALLSVMLDRFGFAVSESNNRLPNLDLVKRDKLRDHKWLRMVIDWEQTNKHNPRKLKQRIRKGIPEALRARVWPLLLHVSDYELTNPTSYSSKSNDFSPIITRDIDRTFPQHVLFKKDEGKQLLRRVAERYAKCDSDIGYCQSMSYVIAMLLVYLPEDAAFAAFWALQHRNNWRQMYHPKGLPLLHKALEVNDNLIALHFKGLSKHMNMIGVSSVMFAVPWFHTLFVYRFPFAVSVRIFECYLHEGPKVLFRASLALFKLSKKVLLSTTIETFFIELTRSIASLKEDVFVEAMFSINLKSKTLRQLGFPL